MWSATGDTVKLVWAGQGYTGDLARDGAKVVGIESRVEVLSR